MAAVLSELATEILTLWFLVARVKLTPEPHGTANNDGKNGYGDSLIEEEEGINNHGIVARCAGAEIQSAISEAWCIRACKKPWS